LGVAACAQRLTEENEAARMVGWRRRRCEREVARLDALFAQRRWDQSLYCTAAPALPAELIAAYSRLRPRGFAWLLAVLAWHTREQLPYELCDELAAFWAAVFWHAAAVWQRRFALERMLALGPRNRRYAVADQVRLLLWRAHEPGDVALVVEVLERSRWASWYAHHATFRGPLHEAVAAALVRRAAPRAMSAMGAAGCLCERLAVEDCSSGCDLHHQSM
jgi:hypothetical protein